MVNAGTVKQDKVKENEVFDFMTISQSLIKCSNARCVYNDQAGRCSSPSVVQITSSGMCKPFLDSQGISKDHETSLEFFKET